MNNYIILSFLFLLVIVIQVEAGGRCPPENSLNWCTCKDSEVHCTINRVISNIDYLGEEMAKIKENARNDITFNVFELSYSTFTQLTSEMFQGLKFKHIILRYNALTCVGSFEGMENTLTTFESIGTPL